MTEQLFNKLIEHETVWLHYYGHPDERITEEYNDHMFYDRLVSIGYTKKVIALWMRCCGGFITSDRPVLESTVEELRIIGSPRDHEANIYTPLEYMFAKKYGRYMECKNILKECTTETL